MSTHMDTRQSFLKQGITQGAPRGLQRHASAADSYGIACTEYRRPGGAITLGAAHAYRTVAATGQAALSD
jgi:hypothetical protein